VKRPVHIIALPCVKCQGSSFARVRQIVESVNYKYVGAAVLSFYFWLIGSIWGGKK
jgi:hypothetical protein